MNRPYPRYRDSGVAWLGDVPKHWELRPLKSVLAKNDGGVWGDDPDDHDFNGTIVLRSTEQTVDGGWSIGNPARRQLSRRETTSALLAAGDLVVTKSSGSEFHIGKASLVTEQVAQLNACFSNFMQRLRCLPVFEPRLAWYLLNSPVGRQQLVFHSNTTTGLANLNGTILGEVITPVPPLDEQRSIAAFLDRETERIDALVEKKRRLIERLQEYRTALITRTVTRGLPPEAARAAGLDPSPRLKPSGVEWLGDVPEHWEVKKLRFVASTNDETLSAGEHPLRPVSYVDISSVDSTAGIVHTEEMVFDDAPSRARRLVQDGDTIVSTVRTYLRAIAPVRSPPADMVVSTGFAVIRPLNVDPGFASWALREYGFVEEIVACSTGVSYPAINASKIRDLPIPLPLLNEQRAIAAFLQEEIAAIDHSAASIATAVDRLREHRTALITAAVTGKIDVRDAAPEPVAATTA